MAGGQKLGDPRARCDGKALAEEGFPQDRQIEGCTRLIDSGKEGSEDLVKDHFNRATAYDFEGAADKAIDDYNVVIDLRPQNAKAYGSLGMIYRVKNEYDRAIGNFDKAIALNGKRMDLYFPYRGRCHFALGHFALAIADFDRRLSATRTTLILYSAQLRLHRKRRVRQGHRRRRSRDQIVSAVRGDRSLRQPWRCAFSMGDFAAAIDDYTAALKLWPKNPQALYGRGVAKSRRGDTLGAAADMNAARALKAEIAATEGKLGIRP